MIRRLEPSDAEAYVALRQEALVDAPLAFAASPEDDMASSIEAVREQLKAGPDGAIFGAFDGGLVGAAGLGRDRFLKARHKLHVWGMYVRPSHRGRGLGAKLLEAVVAHARGVEGASWLHLSVSSAAPGAQRLYERAGFSAWGTEPDALRHGGDSASELHMALKIG